MRLSDHLRKAGRTQSEEDEGGTTCQCSCGYETIHQAGKVCKGIYCPQCGSLMTTSQARWAGIANTLRSAARGV